MLKFPKTPRKTLKNTKRCVLRTSNLSFFKEFGGEAFWDSFRIFRGVSGSGDLGLSLAASFAILGGGGSYLEYSKQTK